MLNFQLLVTRSTIPNTKTKGLVELPRNEMNGLQHVNTQQEPYLLYMGAPCHPFVARAPQWTYRRFSVL